MVVSWGLIQGWGHEAAESSGLFQGHSMSPSPSLQEGTLLPSPSWKPDTPHLCFDPS